MKYLENAVSFTGQAVQECCTVSFYRLAR